MDDELFDILNGEFPTNHSNIIDYDSFEKIEIDDEFILTIPFTINVIPEDFTITASPFWIDIIVRGELYSFSFADTIIPELTKATLRYGILDIVMRKNKENKILTEELGIVIQ